MTFDKRQTNIAKGIAILLLLWHHLFFNNPENYEKFTSVLTLGGIPIESRLADICKICVAIFVFLSGYGMFKSFNSYMLKLKTSEAKDKVKIYAGYTIKRLLNLLSEFWFVFLIFVPLGFIFGKSPINVYGNVFNFVGDFLGLAQIYKGPTMNATWWYMSLIIVIIVLFPLLYLIVKKYPYEFLTCMFLLELMFFIPDNINLRIYLFTFVLGMVFAKSSLFEKIANVRTNWLLNLLISAILIGVVLYYRLTSFNGTSELDGIFTIPIMMFSFLVLSKIPLVNRAFEQLGKYSGSIFMFHTFIYSYYFKDFIYSFKYSILIFLIMIVICYSVAVLLEWLKKLIGYKKLFDFLCNKAESSVGKEKA